jgi:hypothetical protein
MQQAVRTGTDGSAQSEPAVVELNHGLVNRM